MKKMLALLILGYLCTALKAKEVVTMGVVEFPPYSILDQDTSQCHGLFIDITEKILADKGIELHAVCAPPIRMFKLLEKGEIDFTINVKSTAALPDNVYFVEPHFSTLSLNLYLHKNADALVPGIAAIRGYSYHGFRETFTRQGKVFIDLPSSISAIKMFVKKRSSHLISYRAPLDFYSKNNNLNVDQQIAVTHLLDVPTYLVISKESRHLQRLQMAFENYANVHKLTSFDRAEYLTFNKH